MLELRHAVRSPGLVIAAVLLLLCGCSDDSTAPSDTIPPAAVLNLVAIRPTDSTMTLAWTAPGDDGMTGTAARYDIRYSVSPLTEAVWPSASQVADEPAPGPAGTPDTFVVAGLTPSTYYYFALKTADERDNWSTKSNIASAPTKAATDLGQ
jgi:hypothetical protein